jgi:hypothetical protein
VFYLAAFLLDVFRLMFRALPHFLGIFGQQSGCTDHTARRDDEHDNWNDHS